jgi:hypothetical protein
MIHLSYTSKKLSLSRAPPVPDECLQRGVGPSILFPYGAALLLLSVLFGLTQKDLRRL